MYLDALRLDAKPGKRKVAPLLANIGREAVKIYDSFTWAQQIEEDRDNNIETHLGENKHVLQTVFSEFDRLEFITIGTLKGKNS